jgi:two-component system LytT family sensor kinase
MDESPADRPPPAPPRFARVRAILGAAALVSALWTLVACMFTVQMVLVARSEGREMPVGRALGYQLAGWMSWAIMTPVVIAIARRLGGVRPLAVLAGVHVGPALVVAFSAAALEGVTKSVLGVDLRPRTLAESVLVNVQQYGTFNLFVYAMLAGMYYAIAFARESRERERRAARLETALVQARLDTLAAQIQPHFLFNTLHAISQLVLEDPARANQMITRLSTLLRHGFHGGNGEEPTLADEIELLDHYVAIQEIRFGDRLSVTFDLDPTVLRVRVPSLLLQPLVENAIRLGTATRSDQTRVVISAVRRDAWLRLEVRDNGPGLSRGAVPTGNGVGVANVRERLAQRYGRAQRFALEDAAGGGARAIIEIPWEPPASPTSNGNGHVRSHRG